MNATAATTTPAALTDAEIAQLQDRLDAVPAPLQPMDVMALDGYLCGVLLQPRPVPEAAWMPRVTDLEARPLPAGFDARTLQALVRRRHAEIDRAIAARDWFDPWVLPLEDETSPSETVLPWVAGFAAAMDAFPSLMTLDRAELVEPLAVLYAHFDPEDLEDADALLEVIETLEPPPDLAEAVQDLVRSVMLIADVTRPRAPAGGPRRGAPRARPAPGPRSRSGRRARARHAGSARRCGQPARAAPSNPR